MLTRSRAKVTKQNESQNQSNRFNNGFNNTENELTVCHISSVQPGSIQPPKKKIKITGSRGGSSSKKSKQSSKRNKIIPSNMYAQAPTLPPVLPIVPIQIERPKLIPVMYNSWDTVYNVDLVTVERDIECAICLDNMDLGQVIARLECFCVYHKSCIDLWFKKKVTCPSHPPL